MTQPNNRDAGKRSQFKLAGVSQPFDPRTTAIRADLADIAVAGQHFAPHYAAPVERRVTRAVALRADPAADGEPVAELAEGDLFAVLDVTGEIAWGYRIADHLVGYCPADAFAAVLD